MRPVHLAPLLLAATLGVTQSVQAQESEGERLFKEGLQLLEQAQKTKDSALFDQACERFEKSFAAEKVLSPLLNLARCEEGRGRLRAAWKTWQAAADLARTQGETTAQILAQGGAASLAEKLPKILVRLGEPGRGAKIDIDGEAVNPGEPFIVDPGKHQVRAALGELVDAKEVEADRGVVEISLFEKKLDVTGPAPTPTNPPSDGVDLAIPGWTLVGVGGAAWVGVAVTTGLWFDRCGELPCPSTKGGADGIDYANLAFWIAAPIVTGIGVTLLIVDATNDDTTPAPTVGLRAWSTPDGGRAGVFGSF